MPSSVPAQPLTLDEFPQLRNGPKQTSTPQGLEIAFTGDANAEKILESIRKSDNVQVSLGKRPAVVIDERPKYNLQSLPREHCLIYKRQKNSNDLNLSAILRLKDAAARAKQPKSQELDLNDPAFLALQQNLADLQQKKESNTTILVKDSSRLPPAKSGRQALKASKNFSLLKNHRSFLSEHHAPARSTPTSPSLGSLTPVPSHRSDMKSLKSDALKFSLIHLLAVRPHSKREILDKLKCKSEELEPLLDKYQGRMDGSKYNLSDKGYKELEVWKFPYREPNEREDAIQRAIGAFDRQRISVREDIWQMLLPKEERGKGKVLSRLNLHNGPIERVVKTLQINVEPSGNNADPVPGVDDPESRKGRLDPSSAKTNARSSSQEPAKNKRASEKETTAKRVTTNVPKKTAVAHPAAKTKEIKANHPSVPKKATAPKKNTTATNSKIKSDEFVHDSDEDIDMVEVLSPEPSQKASPKPASPVVKTVAKPSPAAKMDSVKKELAKKESIKKEPIKKDVAAPTAAKKEPLVKEAREPKETTRPVALKAGPAARTASKTVPKTVSKPTAKEEQPSSTPKLKPQPADITQKPVMMARTLSHKRSNSSPKKPSPLGSSPPTNASDMENDNTVKSSKSSSSSNSPLINHRRETGAIARKAPARATETNTGGNSDRGLKRKANDIDSDIHHHDIGASRFEGPPMKRQISSDNDSIRSDSTSDGSQLLSKRMVEESQLFLRRLQNYRKMMRELRAMKKPPREQMEKLRRLHQKITEQKGMIWKWQLRATES